MAILPETAELECNVRVMHLSGGAFSVEISDPAGDDPVAAVGLSADDLALGIAEDIARRIKTSRGD
jgi:hypothetical protein